MDRSDPEHHHPLNQGFDYFYGVPLTNMPDFGDPSDPVMLHHVPHAPFQILLTVLVVLVSAVQLTRAGLLNVWLGALCILATGVVCGGAYFALYNMKLLNSFMFRLAS